MTGEGLGSVVRGRSMSENLAFGKRRTVPVARLKKAARMTDEEVVKQANELARQFYKLRGYVVPEGYRFDTATHPHEREAWSAAVYAFALLRDTDVNDALANLDE